MIAAPESIRRYFDDENRLVQWPAFKRKIARATVLRWLTEHFETGRDYDEREVNAILNDLHTFADPALLRRELFDAGLLDRTRDVRRYWRPESGSATPESCEPPTEEALPDRPNCRG